MFISILLTNNLGNLSMSIDDNLLGYLKASMYRIKILKILQHIDFATPSDITKQLEVNFPQISRTLSELEEINLIQCTTPNRSKGRIYRITEKGIKILNNYGEI